LSHDVDRRCAMARPQRRLQPIEQQERVAQAPVFERG
jgi:hypothetical protein